MANHRITLQTTPGLVATWIDASCSCGGWKMSTLGERSYAMAHAEQHLDDQGADAADFDALCSL